VTAVRRKILRALEEENKKRGLKQADLARAIKVHRSVINRELRGKKDLTLGRLAELTWAMNRVPVFECPEITLRTGTNLPASSTASNIVIQSQSMGVSSATSPLAPANNNSTPVLEVMAN
jgi:predicted transcriptional regulator